MRVYVDVNGTIRNNVAGIPDELVADALLGMVDAGHEVKVCSATPEQDQEDKCRVLTSDLRGCAIIDDDTGILGCALRRGAIAVPAARILDFATMLVR